MNILFVTQEEDDPTARRLAKRGITVDLVGSGNLISRLKSNLNAFAVADAIVLGDNSRLDIASTLRSSEAVAKDIRALPPTSAMADGRRWCQLPIVIVITPDPGTGGLQSGVQNVVNVPDVHVLLESQYAKTPERELIELLKRVVAEYQQRLLDEYDNLGFLISEDHGRLRLGPALSTRAPAESPLYYGPSDQRDATRWVTISRSLLGISYEAEVFEALINKPGVLEAELQTFFEQHPHFLTNRSWARAIAHPNLPRDNAPGPLIPDFVLEPIVAERRARDSEWQILDLKRPQDRLLAGSERRRRLSAKVADAIAQLREYRGYFEDPKNGATIERILGRSIRRPQLAVLIGRQRDVEDLDALDAAQEREHVRIVTYDEVLDRQRALL